MYCVFCVVCVLLWSYFDGSNLFEGFFVLLSLIDGLGVFMGYWYFDVFVGMNVVLLCVFVLMMDDEMFDWCDGD